MEKFGAGCERAVPFAYICTRDAAATVRLALSDGDARSWSRWKAERQAALPSTHLRSKAPSKSGTNVSAAGRGPASECQSFSGQHPEPDRRNGWRVGKGGGAGRR